jgi:predicted nucleotide-binding protein
VARINPKLFARLRAASGLSERRVYALIEAKVRETNLPRHLAAIAVASDHGINIARYATEDDLATIRHATGPRSSAPVSVVTPDSSASGQAQAPRSRSGRKKSKPKSREPRRGNSVFVVHGRNEALRHSVFSFLRSIGLQPIEWRKARSLTKSPTPYVGEILEAAFHHATAIVVVLSPDDEARLSPKFVKPHDPTYEKDLTPQARPNVLFEAGMALGKNTDSTVIVQIGETRPFSDVAGRHTLRLDNSVGARQDFVQRLADAGCNVDASGTDWHTEGDFAVAEPPKRKSRRRKK